jgi:nitroimidazol reductase NimA-like FMN-containing flavoprotein (pyridoxamine 5'-phosphate oxidase superfamily)
MAIGNVVVCGATIVAFHNCPIVAIPGCHLAADAGQVTTRALSSTDRSTIRRGTNRARFDREDLYAVLDAGLVCHLALTMPGADAPVVLPTTYGRDGDTLYVHGSTGAASMRAGAAGVPVCVAVTLLDGVVYGRSVFHNSVNYRSAIVHSGATPVVDTDAKLHALRVLVEHVAPGSWDYARTPTPKELAATSVLAVDLAEASVKVRTGGPGDEPDDIANFPGWAGSLALHRFWGEPSDAGDLRAPVAVPGHVRQRVSRPASQASQ